VYLSIFISVINQLDAQNFCFTISLFHASTCFEHHVLIIRRSKLLYTASDIITPIGVMIPDFCASSWLITEINIISMPLNVLIYYYFINKSYFYKCVNSPSRTKATVVPATLNIRVKLNSVALVRTRTIPTERPPPVGEVSANFCG